MPPWRQRQSHHAKHRPCGFHHPRLLHVLLADRSVTATRRSNHPACRSRVIGCQQSAQRTHMSRLSPTGRHRNICCMVLPAAAASRLDEHKGKLQHIHDRNNHNTPQNTSRNLELTHTRRICSTYTVNNPNTQADDQTNTQTNEPTNMQTTNQSIKRTN